MTLRRRISLWWTDSPWIVRMGVFLIALILALILFGCAELSSPSASAAISLKDPATCSVTGDRLCIGQLWVRIKFALDL